MKNNNTKVALINSILSLLVCSAMLIGTTLALFTEKVENTGNKITSGALVVDLQLVGETSLLSDTPAPALSLKDSTAPAFTFENFKPGSSVTKTFRVVNQGTLPLVYALNLTIGQTAEADPAAPDLSKVILISINDGEPVTLKAFMEEKNGLIFGGRLDLKDAYQDIKVTVSMDINADISYQASTIAGIDVVLSATQTTD